MIISGNTFRKVLRDNKFSFNFDASFDSCTGVSEMGFSGQGQTYKFSFISGKIYDNDGRYFFSYIPNSQVNIESNFSGSFYDYIVNNDRVIFSGSKSNFYAERFYINTTGATIDSTLTIRANKPSLTLSTNQTFITGLDITGHLLTNSPSGLQVLSGEFEDGSTFYFKSFPTGFITSASSGQVLIGQNVTGVGAFLSDYTIHTSAGSYDNSIQISGVEVPYLNYTFELADGLDTLDSVSNILLESGITKYGEIELDYGYNTNDTTLVPASLPLNISLSYSSGITGYLGQIIDVEIIDGGSGYLSPPYIIFSGGFSGNGVQAISSINDQFRRTNSIPFTFASGQSISFYKPSGSTLPSPLQENYTYYVRDLYSGANTIFTISASGGGPRFDITNTGVGNFYFYDPTRTASGTAILGVTSVDYDKVIDVEMTSFGSGYTSIPTVIFSGGTGVINNQYPAHASGLAQTSFYTKSFTGFFDLFTGLDYNYSSYSDNNYISGLNYVRNNVSLPANSSVNIKVSYDTSFDEYPLVAKLSISGANNNIIERYITGLK